LNLARNTQEPKQFKLYTSLQDSGRFYRLIIPQIKDTTGNIQSEIQSTGFRAETKTDTTHFEILKILPADSVADVGLGDVITIEFSLPIDTAQMFNNFSLHNMDSTEIRGQWKWKELSLGEFSPETEFLPERTYFYNFSTIDLKSLWGDTLTDTTMTKTFFTLKQDEFGSISGNLEYKGVPTEIVYVIFRELGDKHNYSTRVQNDLSFSIDWVLAGKYKLGGFVDLDKNGNYSPGSLNPFVYAEPFIIQDDTLRVRKRWELSDLFLSIPGW
jgi:hypothetical protein